MTSRARDESGAALILAIVFMVVVGAISGATLSMLSSGLADRVVLDKVRNRQYAADGGVEAAIASVRPAVEEWAKLTYTAPPLQALGTFLSSADLVPSQCPPPVSPSLNQVKIWVKCTPAPALHNGYFEFNVIFSACTDSGCSGTPVVNAQVNFDFDKSSGTVTKTYVQAWSVNT